MRTKPLPQPAIRFAASSLLLLSVPVQGADVVKENNDNNLIGGNSWVGGVPPTAADLAVFDDVYGIENNSLFTGGPIDWAGVRITGSVPRSKAWIANGTYTARVKLGADGVDLSAAPRDLDIYNVEIDGNQTWSLASGRIFEVGSVGFRGTGDIDIVGDGRVILKEDTGGGSYSGVLSVSGGTLELQALPGGDVVVEAGGTLESEIFLPNDLTLNSGTLVIDAATPDVIDVNQLTLTGTSTVTSAADPLPGVVDVARYFSLVGGTGNLAFDPVAAAKLRTPPVIADSGGTITLEFFPGESLGWTGATDGVWDVATTANWDNGGPTPFYNLDEVSFGDAGANRAITIAETVSPASISFTNSTGTDYNFSGPGGIGGTGDLAKSGDGIVTLATPNTFGGATTITGGTLVADWTNGNPLGGTASIDLAAPATLELTHQDGDLTLAAPIAGDGAITLRPITSGSSVDNRNVSLSGDNSAFTGSILLASPASSSWRLSQPAPADSGSAIIVENGAQFWAADATYTQPITLTGDGFLDTDGPLGALRLVGTTATAGGTRWAGPVTITGTPGDSGGTAADASIGFNAGNSSSFYAFVDGPISGGDLGIRSYSATGRERFRLTAANSYGDTLLYANDVALGTSGEQVQLIVGEPGNTSATLGTGTIYLSGGANGKVATLVIERDDGYVMPGDVLSIGNTAATRFISDTQGVGVSTGGHDIIVGEEIRIAANIGNCAMTIEAGSTLSAMNLNVGNSGGLFGTLTMTGGDVTVSDTFQAGPSGTGVIHLNGGSVTLASGGLVGTPGSELHLGGVSILATASAPLDFPLIEVTAPSSIDIDGNNLACTGGITGTAPLTINDSTGGSYFDFNIDADATVEAPIAGTATIGKLGAGTLTLAGANTFTGGISVDDGGLALTGSLSGSDITVNDATLHTGGALVGNLSIGGFGTPSLAYTGSPLAVDGNVELLNTIEVDPFTAGSLPAGSYELITFTGTLTGGAGNLVLPAGFAPADFRQTFSFSADGDSIDLVVAGSPGDLAWDGPGDWDLLTTMPWSGGESFYQLDGVTFDDTASGGSVNLVGSLTPSAVVVDNDALAYSFSGTGSIDGPTSLVKQGPGTLTIENVNAYTGGTLIKGGVIEVAGPGALGSGPVTLSAGTLRSLAVNPDTIPLILGDADSGTAETVVEFPGNTVSGTNGMVMPVTVSGDAPDSKAILRCITTEGRVTYYGGPITLENRDVYFESAGNQLTGINAPITGTGDLHITRAPGALARTRLLSNANDFIGDVYVDGEAQIQITSGGGGSSNVVPFGSDLILGPDAQLRMGASESIDALHGGGGIGNISLAVSGSTVDCRLTVGEDGGSGSYIGTINDQSANQQFQLTKIGSGTQIIGGVCNFTGSTIVSGGLLQLDADPYASPVTVGADAILGGTGNLTSDVTATAPGATIAPGASTGVMTVGGNVDLAGGTLAIEIDDASIPANDRLDVAGTLFLGGGTLDVAALGSVGQASYLIATYGFLDGTFAVENLPAGYAIDYAWDDGSSTNNIALVATGTTDYDLWASGFPGFTDTDPGEDPDGDGLNNDEEYAFGLDPTDAADASPIKDPLDKADGMFTYTRRDPALTGLSYAIETSGTLDGWTEDLTATQNVTGTIDGVQTVEVTLSGVPLTDTRLFARVVATP